MTRELLMKHGADHINATDYPDTWQQDNLILPLSYHFDPGQALDGVVVNIPLALLNQINDEGFDWHIPALRHELVCGLIKSLPKTLRRNFVPAPNYADAVLASVEVMQGPFLEAVANRLLKMTGVKVAQTDWDTSSLEPHLKMQFQVVNEHGKVIAHGFNLSSLKAKLQGQVTQTLSQVAEQGIEQTDIQQWNFGELPEQYTKKTREL